MGRTLKRVPMDFAWPIGKIWEGYINPHYKATKCPYCDGGFSADYKRLEAQWYSHLGGNFRPEMRGSVPFRPDEPVVVDIIRRKLGRDSYARFCGEEGIRREAERMCEIWNTSWSHHLNADDVQALLDADRLWDFTRTTRTDEQREIVRKKIEDGGNSWLPESNGYVPTPREVNEWSLSGFSHDSHNCWIVVKAELARLGRPVECNQCNGEADVWATPEDKAAYDAWKDYEPPTGEGFQLWETTTEGSPDSPVFATIDELCAWCETGATTFGSARASAAEWRRMLDENFVCHRSGNAVFI